MRSSALTPLGNSRSTGGVDVSVPHTHHCCNGVKRVLTEATVSHLEVLSAVVVETPVTAADDDTTIAWYIFTDPNWGNISCIKQNMQLNQTRSSRCLSTGHVHAAVAAAAWVI